MEKVRPWCGQPSDRGRLKNRNSIAKNGGGYTQTGVAEGLKVPCLFMIAEVCIYIRCQKTPEVGIRRIPAYTPQYTTDYNYLLLVLYNLYSIREEHFEVTGHV